MWLMWMTLALIAPRPAWCWATMEEQYVGDSPKTLDPDFNKLNEYLQADKENGVHMESLYADLQKRFGALKREWDQAEGERQSMRKALRSAQASVQRLSAHNARLTATLAEVSKEQMRLTSAKANIMSALGLGVNLTEVLQDEAVQQN